MSTETQQNTICGPHYTYDVLSLSGPQINTTRPGAYRVRGQSKIFESKSSSFSKKFLIFKP